MSHLSVSTVARQLGVPPRKITDLFYRRKLSDSICPVVDGRRIIPAEYVPAVEAACRDAGLRKPQEVSTDG